MMQLRDYTQNLVSMLLRPGRIYLNVIRANTFKVDDYTVAEKMKDLDTSTLTLKLPEYSLSLVHL